MGRNEVNSRRTGGDVVRPAEMLEGVLSTVREVLEMDIAFVSESVGDRQVFRAVEGGAAGSCEVREGGSPPLEGHLRKRVIENGASGALPAGIPDAGTGESVRDPDVTREAGAGSYVGFPLRLSDGRLYGTLRCVSRSPDPWLRERDLRLMGNLARRATALLERKGLL